MRPVFTPDSVFRAWTLAIEGNPDVGDGVHLRVWFDPRLGLPLHPFVAFRVSDFGFSDASVLWSTDDGQTPSPPFQLEQYRPVTADLVPTASNGFASSPCCAIVQADPGAKIEAALLNRKLPDRTVARWVDEQPIVTGYPIARIRLAGRGTVQGVTVVDISAIAAAIVSGAERPDVIFGLPVRGDAAWYADGEGEEAAMKRVGLGAPRRLGPPDHPNGADVATSPNDEIDRLHALAPELVGWVKAAISTAGVPSARARLAVDDTADPSPLAPRKSSVEMRYADALMTAAVDPGIARFLGFATTLSRRLPDRRHPEPWIVATLFAVDTEDALLPNLLGPPTLQEGQVAAALKARFPQLTQIEQDLPTGWTIRALFTSAAVGPAPLNPPPPSAKAERGSWNLGRPSTSWSQSIVLKHDPPLGPMALARIDATGPVPLQQVRATPGTFPERRVALVAGRNAVDEPVVVDLGVPEGLDPATWLLWQADLLGRWSGHGEVAAAPPARPPPQPPRIETDLRLDSGETDDMSSRSPGALTIRIPIPPRSALAPGARVLQSLTTIVDGAPETVPIAQPLLFDATAVIIRPLQVKPTEIGRTAATTIVAQFADSGGVMSEPATATVIAHDPRRPPALKTAPTLIWTSRRDATGQAEVSLSWPKQAQVSAYRVYLSDDARLGSALGLAPRGTGTRAHVAKLMSDAGPNAKDKAAFSLATDTPLQPDGHDRVNFNCRVSGSLARLILARVVPLTEGNVEAAYDRCGLACVAIPHDEKPIPPIVTLEPEPDGRFSITIAATGLRPEILNALQPNLLGGGAGEGRAPPEFRLKRTQGTANALYAREVLRGRMEAEAGSGGTRWVARVKDGPAGGFPPFVRFTWFAEVRYPAEIGREPGAQTQVSPDGVGPGQGAVQGDMESPWSEASLPQTTMLVAQGPPRPPVDAAARRDQAAPASIQITIPDPPVAAVAAVAPYRVRIWRRASEEPFRLFADAPTTAPFAMVDYNAISAEEYAVAYVDPLDREGPAAVITVA